MSILFKKILLTSIRMYQYILSPLMPPTCRFYPTCSEYAYQAVFHYGVFKGLFLALKRILKCHPFHKGGFDPIPKPIHEETQKHLQCG